MTSADKRHDGGRVRSRLAAVMAMLVVQAFMDGCGGHAAAAPIPPALAAARSQLLRFSDVSSLATDWSEKGTVSVDGVPPSRVTDPTEIAEGHCLSHTTGAEIRVPSVNVAFRSPGFAIYELIEPNVPAERKIAEYREPGASACRSAFLHAEPPKTAAG